MKRFILTILASSTLILALPAHAGLEEGLAAYEQGDYATALKELRPLAEQGNPIAQRGLGLMYAQGLGVQQDNKEAAKWFRRAAEQGDLNAQYNLGWMYQEGQGVPRDYKEAVKWYRQAAEQGFADAQYNLGRMYADGYGVPRDYKEAVKWFRKAAEQGDAGAQSMLGLMYVQGQGVPQDYEEAVKWFRKAAEQGNAAAQGALGLIYEKDKGVPKRNVLAYALFNLAATNENIEFFWKERDRVAATLSTSQLLEGQALTQELMQPGNFGKALDEWLAKSVRQPVTPAKRVAGTMFVVSRDGHAITNAHVVEGCTELRMSGREGVVTIVTKDAVNDLALLKIPGEIKAAATINNTPDKLRQGEEVVVFGFPLNAVLSSGGNLTPGVISALTGLGNNTNQIQITAPIQPGSSGSPVINKKGEVVGVVSMKLSDTRMANVTGQISQNVNFAVNGLTLKTFLDAHKVSYRTGGFISFEKSAADLAEEARKWTFVVECWK